MTFDPGTISASQPRPENTPRAGDRFGRVEDASRSLQVCSQQNPDILCLSHLRWEFVFQRPQHLLNRFAKKHRVFFFEEPVFDHRNGNTLEIRTCSGDVTVITPKLVSGMTEAKTTVILKRLFGVFADRVLRKPYIAWYYTPMALEFTGKSTPLVTVYDCMDELSAFANAHPRLVENERQLMASADVVFTGGHSLYEAKRHLHSNIHPMPSSIDKHHFERAKSPCADPFDQKNIPFPRIGFFGVVDERFDHHLIGSLAEKRKDWHFVIIGPIIKIDPGILPRAENIHYLGGKKYDELPNYLAHWNVAILPFAMNESTRFISPTKTPEYLAGGCPVVSTPIKDVVRSYGKNGLVHIGGTVEEFERGITQALLQKEDEVWMARVNRALKKVSWDQTWEQMSKLVMREYEKNVSTL